MTKLLNICKCAFKKEDKKDREVRGGAVSSSGMYGIWIHEPRRNKPIKNFDVSFLPDFLNNLYKCS
ncbi:hypothetical protein AOX59_14495 [Lentibacillus amyloliquefaciens]|uniref:Uncharacterized protein n=1 Tax=Lentibacillus amyloliquefaciens TaxID=1472767 RepID=A0A0U4F2E8_9BACI|nr:hypothetical protein AOX59_14495 [Lentibacillus amyloliquefaciens]